MLVSVENMTNAEIAVLDAETARDMARRGYVGIPLSETVDVSPVSPLSHSVHQFFARFVAPVLDRAYDALKPAMVPNQFAPWSAPDDVRFTEERYQQYRASHPYAFPASGQKITLAHVAFFQDQQSDDSTLGLFWNNFFKPRQMPVQHFTPTKTATTVDALADQFFNTPEPDYALGSGETLVVQFKSETADKYLTLLEGHATITPVAKDRHVYRLSDVHLTKKGVAELKKAASFTLLVDDHVKARYDVKNEVVHFDTGLVAALARALGGRKVTEDHYVVQPHNGSTQKLLDTVQKYELPVHAIDLRNGVFVFDGRYRLPPALLNSTTDQHVVSPAVYRSGARVYDIARRVAEARNASPPSSQPSPN